MLQPTPHTRALAVEPDFIAEYRMYREAFDGEPDPGKAVRLLESMSACLQDHASHIEGVRERWLDEYPTVLRLGRV